MKAQIFRLLTASACVLGFAAGMAITTSAKAQDALEPFIGTIRYFGFSFAPRNWAHCDGQLLAISQNSALFSLLGTTYGGDGRTTFALPDLRGRVPVHMGQGAGLSNRRLGEKAGEERVTLNANQIGHSHNLLASTGEGNETSPTGNTLAQDAPDKTYRDTAPNVAMAGASISSATSPPAGGQSHENMPPFLGVYCNIALVGIFPSRP